LLRDGLFLVHGHVVDGAESVVMSTHGLPREDWNVSSECDAFGMVDAL
jgi:hypothetical protein